MSLAVVSAAYAGLYWCQLLGHYADCDVIYADVDECQVPPQNTCSQQCNNEEPGFTCSCWAGYRLSTDGNTCSGM